MRYIVNSSNYVLAVGFGCDLRVSGKDCTEYTGRVPSGWGTLEEWYEDEGDKLWRWKIVSGNLTLDSSAKAPEEGRWGEPKLQDKTVTGAILSQTTVKPDDGYDGLGSVVIDAQTYWKDAEESDVSISNQASLLVENAVVSEKNPWAVEIYFSGSPTMLSSGEIVSAHFTVFANTVISCCVVISSGNGTFTVNTTPSSWSVGFTASGMMEVRSASSVGWFYNTSYKVRLMY